MGKKRVLYFGLDPSRYHCQGELIHLPLICTKPFPFAKVKHFFSVLHTHVLFTSRMAVTYYFDYTNVIDKIFLCIGAATADRLLEFGVKADWIADEACGEGVIALLESLDCGHILYPHSAKARPLLPNYLRGKGTAFALYDTFSNKIILPDLSFFDTLVFTSPSTVGAFQALCPFLPPREKCEAIGVITQNALNKLFDLTIVGSQNTKT